MSSKSKLYFSNDNISSIFMTTALAMISNGVTGVIAVLIDGIIASQLLGENVYAGISLLRPFISLLLVLAGFLSTGCASVCSKLVTQGRRQKANRVFHFTTLLALAGSVALILFCLLFPSMVLRLCGVPLNRSAELIPYTYEYLNGYIIGIAPLLLIQISGPILVMDGGRLLFTVSSIALCTSDIIGDLLNVLYSMEAPLEWVSPLPSDTSFKCSLFSLPLSSGKVTFISH